MRKILIIGLAFICASAAFGQGVVKQKVAVYTEDNSGKNYADFAGDMLTNAIVKRGIYDASERTSSFLSLINKEHAYGRSGAVDENTIAKIGEQLGVQFVCAVKIGIMDGSPFISARLIEVKTVVIKGTARPKIFTGIGDIEAACDAVIASMFGERGSSGNSGYAGSSSSSSSGSNYTETGGNVNIEMIFAKGGAFTMGCTSEQGGDCENDESPTHQVTVDDFYIGKYEVTQAQWQAVMGTSITRQRDKTNTSYPMRGEGSDYPMYYVSWEEAMDFCRELSRMTGKQYRLLTEAEWEYAARGGKNSTGAKYSGGSSPDRVAWYTDNSSSTTHPVGTKLPNELGIYDMSGNVWEWCSDWYGSYSSSTQTNPTGPTTGSYRVYRGGSWSYNAASD
jgi:formylglycine-generating enzyme required for sulfatase activity